jgi:hypothetical protein
VGVHPETPNVRVLAPYKFNLGPTPPAQAFVISGESVAVRVQWLGEVEVSADELVQPGVGGKRSEARDFLARVLAGGPRAATEIKELARHAGISDRTLYRAGKDIGVERLREGYQAPVLLCLPSQGGDLAKYGGDLAKYGEALEAVTNSHTASRDTTPGEDTREGDLAMYGEPLANIVEPYTSPTNVASVRVTREGVLANAGEALSPSSVVHTLPTGTASRQLASMGEDDREERAAIMEYEGGIPRTDAERQARVVA